MNIEELTTRIHDNFKVSITDIFGRRIYPGDVVYCVSQNSKEVKIGIVSKLTDKFCKLLDDNRLFSSGELCLLKDNEDAAASKGQELKDKLNDANAKKKAEKNVDTKDVIYIMKTNDGKKWLGNHEIVFNGKVELLRKLKEFVDESNAEVKFLCRKKDLSPYFTTDIKDSDIYMPARTNSLYWKAIRLRYVSSDIKNDYAVKIHDMINRHIEDAYGSVGKRLITKISSIEDVKSISYQMLFDDDFLFLCEDSLVKSDKHMVSFYYYFLCRLVQNFYRFKKYEFSPNNYCYVRECDIVEDMFVNHRNESVDRMVEMYQFLKQELISL